MDYMKLPELARAVKAAEAAHKAALDEYDDAHARLSAAANVLHNARKALDEEVSRLVQEA